MFMSFFLLCCMQPLQVSLICLPLFVVFLLFARCWMWAQNQTNLDQTRRRKNQMLNLSRQNCHIGDILLGVSWSKHGDKIFFSKSRKNCGSNYIEMTRITSANKRNVSQKVIILQLLIFFMICTLCDEGTWSGRHSVSLTLLSVMVCASFFILK